MMTLIQDESILVGKGRTCSKNILLYLATMGLIQDIFGWIHRNAI